MVMIWLIQQLLVSGILFGPNSSSRNILYEAIRKAGCSNALMAHYIIDESLTPSSQSADIVAQITGYSTATVHKW